MNVDKQKRRDLLDRAAGDLAASQNDVRKWSPETVREHALKWAATQDLVIPDASPIVAGRTLAPGESALYLYREDGFWDYPVMALPPEVRVDGAVIVWLRNGGYLPVVLAPGVYTVTVDSFPRQSMKPAGESTVTSLKVQTLPGQAQYVTVRIPQLTLHPHWTPVLTVRSEAEALPALKQVKPVPTTMSPHTPPKTPKDFRQYETVKLVVADEVQTPYSQEGVPLFEAFLKGRLQYLGYAVGDTDSDLTLEVRVLRFDAGNRTARLLVGFGVGRAVLTYVATFKDRSGTLITQMEGGASYYGMEIPDHPYATFIKTESDIRLGLIREAAVRAGRSIRNNGELK